MQRFLKIKVKQNLSVLTVFISIVVLLISLIFTSFLLSNKNSLINKSEAAVSNSLPSFGLGLALGQGDTWGPKSGIPWNYNYQYLVTGWEGWNSNGTFATNYANEKDKSGYIPVFPYYELLYFTGSCDSCGENQKDVTHLNDSTVMTNYINNFKLLMKRLGPNLYDGVQGFGKTAVIDIDPDLGGYAMQAVLNNASCFGFCTGQGNNPAFLKTIVNGTGISELTGKSTNGQFIYPNTFQGFIWGLLHLRDLYAPNVKLAFHVSAWGSGTDIGSSKDSNLNITAEAQKMSTFVNQLGIQNVPAGSSTLDLLFSDPLDRDAGYYKSVYGNPNVWWDRLNVAVPNFHRYQSYISTVSQATGKSFMLWQIPIGNQYFATENNTSNHYQDNRVEYYLGANQDFSTNHIQELKNAGIIGLLFGAGAGGQSNYSDQGPDGVTNPASICTTDGISTGQICNNHTSTMADDDGGYLRIMAGKYYASLTGATTTPTAMPVVTTTPIVNANCVCGSSNNLCSNSCTFTGTSNAGLSCGSEIGTPTTIEKNSYCSNELRTKGDADGDGIINSLDYIYYVRAVNGGTIPTKINPDFNGDGKISVSDRAIVIQNIQK